MAHTLRVVMELMKKRMLDHDDEVRLRLARSNPREARHHPGPRHPPAVRSADERRIEAPTLPNLFGLSSSMACVIPPRLWMQATIPL
jgi:hypothetical protein